MTASPPLSTPSDAPAPLRLLCHPATPCQHSLAVSCAVWTDDAHRPALHLRYELQGELSLLRLPARAFEGPADGLWQHTCFEAFVMPPGATAYQEFNFSPSGQWASYRFSAQRVRDRPAELAQQHDLPTTRPHLQIDGHAERLVLHATLAHEAVARPSRDRFLHLNLTAVLEDQAGQLSYWALHHPTARPDFHHPDGFVHPLPWPVLPLTPLATP